MSNSDLTSQDSRFKPSLIVGLGGHIDHGKTSLVRALTGKDTRRALERKLGMTQDINFAHFTTTTGIEVAITDVPGHERYLRNMVAGASQIDVMLLVVAATEGCMAMTITHTQIAVAMGVERIIVCITKADMVSKRELEQVEEEVLETIMDCSGLVPDIITTSIYDEASVDDVKRHLCQYAQEIDSPADATQASSSLYIDRSFSIQGVGTVITGTLSQGVLAVGDKVVLEPDGIEGKIRAVQAIGNHVAQIEGKNRVALILKGIPKQKLVRGSLLRAAKNKNIRVVTQCIIKPCINQTLSNCLGQIPMNRRPNKRVLACLGTKAIEATLIKVNGGRFYRVVFDTKMPVQLNQNMVFLALNEGKVLAAGMIAWDEHVPRSSKRALLQQLDRMYSARGNIDRVTITLRSMGYCKSSEPLEMIDNAFSQKGYIIEQDWFNQVEEQAYKTISAHRTLSNTELAHLLELELGITEIILLNLKQKAKIVRFNGKWQLGDGESEDDLSSEELQLLEHIRSFGSKGFERDKSHYSYKVQWLRLLAHKKYITAISDNIYFDTTIYRTLTNKVLAGFQPRDEVTLQEIKQRVALSRKYLLPLVNRMERDGYLARRENTRLVLRID
ncbi:SelB C-terminal domain-containing protein [Vibrio variabilis]|uniref:SelB domain-containing protein n=1 Tax=Vibrio variabilis TaxID=990271 RepID=UPI0013A6A2F8|nr:SelB C-terminal domain-containing protein [Vibrio variabilis]